MKYPYLLLDADNTLFDFDAGNRHAFHEVCARYDIPDTDESFLCYERCNNAMWTAFDRGECTKDFLVVERFRLFLKEMGLDRNPVLCNDLHLQVLGQNTLMLPHAQEVCRMLSQEHAGIPCCWYNPKKAARPGDLRIDYEIRDLRQLYDLV